MMTWQAIDTAPKDGTVIITNEGSTCFIDNRPLFGWYLCDSDGYVPSCGNEGISISKLNPNKWMNFPE
jgi:hypothetical protein